MFVNLKSALLYCHQELVKRGYYHFAHSLLQFLNGNEFYCCAAVQAITLFSTEIIEKELL